MGDFLSDKAIKGLVQLSQGLRLFAQAVKSAHLFTKESRKLISIVTVTLHEIRRLTISDFRGLFYGQQIVNGRFAHSLGEIQL